MRRVFTKHQGLLIAGALALAPISALAHGHLDHAKPAVGATVAAPKEVSLWFTEAVEPKFSSIVVQDAKGTAMQIGKAEVAADNAANLKIKVKPLTPGVYSVTWKILSVDTHRTQGTFSFTVSP
ncbi:copper homeostasis periplasmic binding protein CopC [Undibacter mobilis]|uniref:Copper resistance protein CopC n=1 Tax=Undibacter mobilis TaxID=2292256 RepID=A0A371B136_9BRAD|nr:copper homeostasis periplasmic binding protein CopC [Undibacter mobilis]RDV01260.1 copper resistance protein CopC [Undibacter mobilis]